MMTFFATRKFRPGVIETGIAILLALFLASLGVWQLNRADEKAAIASEIEQQQQLPGISVQQLLELDREDWIYRKLQVTGKFSDRGMLYVDNQIRNGVAGFDVLMPMQISGFDKDVLVNRGWVPQRSGSRELPVVSVEAVEMSVEGILLNPSSRPFMPSSTEPLNMQGNNLWLYLDLEKYVQEYAGEILPILLQAQGDASDGYQREAFHFESKESMHLGYAIQWFGLATIVAIIWLVISFRQGPAEA